MRREFIARARLLFEKTVRGYVSSFGEGVYMVSDEALEPAIIRVVCNYPNIFYIKDLIEVSRGFFGENKVRRVVKGLLLSGRLTLTASRRLAPGDTSVCEAS